MAGPRRSTFRANQVSYASIGLTKEPGVLRFPPAGFRAGRASRRIGSGQDRFIAASQDLLSGAFFARAGIAAKTTSGSLVSADALRGETATIRLSRLWLPWRGAHDFRVIYVVREDRRVAFALGSLGVWPVRGEVSFAVTWRDDDTVWSEVTTVTSLNPHWFVTTFGFAVRLRESRVRTLCARAVNPVQSVA